MNENLYHYLFIPNPYQELWYAVPKKVYSLWSSGLSEKGVLKSKNIDTLIELVSKDEKFIKSVK